MALRVAASRDPLGLPGGIADDTIQRWMSRVRDVVRGLQQRERRRLVVVHLEAASASVAEGDVLPRVDRDLELLSADWSQSAAVTASSSNYWTLYLRQGPIGKTQSTVSLARATTVDGLAANEALSLAIGSPLVPRGNRITFEREETGAASNLGPGVLSLLFREVD